MSLLLDNLQYTIPTFLFLLTLLVFVHEMGHYLVGRWSESASWPFPSASDPSSSAGPIATAPAGNSARSRLAAT